MFAGVVGLFASKAAALMVARETCQQQKLATRGNAEEPGIDYHASCACKPYSQRPAHHIS